MGYILLVVTGVASIFALRFWLKLLQSRVSRLKDPAELGNLRMDDIGVIGMDRPDPFRTFCNGLALTLCALVMGLLPHWLAIWQFWRRPEIDLWHYVHYAWTLAYWLAFLALPAFVIVRSGEARARRLAGRSSDS